MTTLLERVAWEPSLIEPSPDRTLEAYARRKQGMPNPLVRYFAAVPWLARALVDLHPEYGLLMHLEQRVADLVSLVVSQENSCRFCYAAVRVMLWSQGMSLARIQHVEHDLTRADLPPRTVAALTFARSQSRSGPAAVGQVLTHLDAPELDAVERLLVAFARETIWYEPAPMQRRARALREHLSSAQVLEAIGVAAVANGLCRMGAMVLDRR